MHDARCPLLPACPQPAGAWRGTFGSLHLTLDWLPDGGCLAGLGLHSLSLSGGQALPATLDALAPGAAVTSLVLLHCGQALHGGTQLAGLRSLRIRSDGFNAGTVSLLGAVVPHALGLTRLSLESSTYWAVWIGLPLVLPPAMLALTNLRRLTIQDASLTSLPPGNYLSGVAAARLLP